MTHAGRSPPLPKARLEALTDGIFAVTMTLLVLDLRVPQPRADQTLFESVATITDKLDNYVISFVVLAVFWIGHLRLFRRCGEPDVPFVVLNLAFLFCTTLVPPLTTLLGDNPNLPRAAVLYGGNLLLILASEAWLCRRVCLRLANETLADPPATWRGVRGRYVLAMGIVVLGVAAALAEIAVRSSADIAPWVFLLLIAAGLARPPV
jgi:uncharacterized membrane protein